MKKAQVSIETLMMIGVIIVFFISIVLFAFYKNIETRNTEDYLDRKDNCLKISGLISEAYTNGHGTLIISNTKYNITIEDELLVDDNGIGCYYHANILSSEIKNNFRIRNLNNNIIIENV